jgi:hypothetical protein
MPWVWHDNRKYFYRSVRMGSRVVRRYLGSGAEAERAAAEIEQRRKMRATQVQLAYNEAIRHDEAIAPLAELCRLTDLLVGATFTDQGFHQHDRGAWRRRRVRANEFG